jgi:hypothetical protein
MHFVIKLIYKFSSIDINSLRLSIKVILPYILNIFGENLADKINIVCKYRAIIYYFLI